jgi:hypothetical protein
VTDQPVDAKIRAAKRNRLKDQIWHAIADTLTK